MKSKRERPPSRQEITAIWQTLRLDERREAMYFSDQGLVERIVEALGNLQNQHEACIAAGFKVGSTKEDPFMKSVLGKLLRFAADGARQSNDPSSAIVTTEGMGLYMSDDALQSDLFPQLISVLPDMLAPRPDSKRYPLPAPRWKQLWDVLPSSFTDLEQQLLKTIEQAFWAIGAAHKKGESKNQVEPLDCDAVMETLLQEELVNSQAALASKTKKKKKKRQEQQHRCSAASEKLSEEKGADLGACDSSCEIPACGGSPSTRPSSICDESEASSERQDHISEIVPVKCHRPGPEHEQTSDEAEGDSLHEKAADEDLTSNGLMRKEELVDEPMLTSGGPKQEHTNSMQDLLPESSEGSCPDEADCSDTCRTQDASDDVSSSMSECGAKEVHVSNVLSVHQVADIDSLAMHPEAPCDFDVFASGDVGPNLLMDLVGQADQTKSISQKLSYSTSFCSTCDLSDVSSEHQEKMLEGVFAAIDSSSDGISETSIADAECSSDEMNVQAESCESSIPQSCEVPRIFHLPPGPSASVDQWSVKPPPGLDLPTRPLGPPPGLSTDSTQHQPYLFPQMQVGGLGNALEQLLYLPTIELFLMAQQAPPEQELVIADIISLQRHLGLVQAVPHPNANAF